MESLLLKTRRLLLRSATPEIAAADLRNRLDFSRLLNAHIPEDWPPPLNDENSKTFTLHYLEKNPEAAGWSAWYFLLPEGTNGKSQAIGIGGFKERPSRGTVEVGYSLMPAHQGLGFASEAVAGLVDWAFSHPEVQLVTAETLPSLAASMRVLEKNGFRLIGPGSEEGVVRYARKKSSG